MGPYVPYGLFQTTREMCAKFGSDRFRNVDLYKVQTNIHLYLLNFDSGEELDAFIGLQTVMEVNAAAVLKRK